MVKKASAADDAAAAPARKADNPKPAKASGSSGPGGLTRFALMAVLGSTLALLAGTYFIQNRVIDAGVNDERARLASTYARQYAAFLNQVLGQSARQIGSIAASGTVREALASGNEARIGAVAGTLAASLGEHAQVFVIHGASSLENIPLGFAAQDMAERVRRGEPARPEVIPLKDRPLLLMAAPVKDSGDGKQILGAVLVGFDLNDVRSNLKVFDTAVGQMELRQSVDDSEARTVLSYGTSGDTGGQVAEEQTLYPHLNVVFTLNPSAVVSQVNQTLWVIAAIILLLVIVAILAGSALADREVRRNASMLLQLAEKLVRRERVPVGIQFTLGAFEEVAGSLTRNARGIVDEPPPAAARGTAARSTRSSGNDMLVVDDVDVETAAPARGAPSPVADEIFRAYDIRGVVGKTITENTMRLIGQAIGSEALDNGQQALYVGRDGRLSGPQMVEAFVQGVTSTGCRVINLGMAPTPVVYFAAANSAVKSCVVITGSHNPPDYNGLKIVINGETLADQRIQGLKQRIIKGDFRSGSGSSDSMDFLPKYLERIRDDIVLARNMKVVVDCGNGVAGAVAPQLLSAIGCDIVPLYCDVDGHFPNHHPDPSKPENLKDLIEAVAREGADLGLAFDGDGDRIGVVTPQGQVIFPDRLMMLYARDLLMRNPGADIIFDVKCTRDLATVISQNGGRPVMWRTGHSLIKAKLKETGAALAGEMSGHIFFNDRWPGFDDAMYAAARLLEILSLEVESIDEVFAGFPQNISTPEISIPVAEQRKFAIVDALQQSGEFPGGNITTIDGVRVDFADSWGLLRASNTTPTLVARFEARTDEELARVQGLFREQLARIEPSLTLPF